MCMTKHVLTHIQILVLFVTLNKSTKLKSQLDFGSIILWGQAVCVASLPKGIFGIHWEKISHQLLHLKVQTHIHSFM